MSVTERRQKKAGGLGETIKRHRPGAAAGAGHPHLPVPALHHSVRLDDARHCWSAIICSSPNTPTAIRAIRCPFSPNLFCGPHLGGRTRTRRCRRVQVPAKSDARLHQAGDRPAGRQDPDDRTACSTSMASRSSARRSARSTIRTSPKSSGPVDVYRETLPNGVTYDTLDLNPELAAATTRASFDRAARALSS